MLNGEKFNKFAEERSLYKCACTIVSKSLVRVCDVAFCLFLPIQNLRRKKKHGTTKEEMEGPTSS